MQSFLTFGPTVKYNVMELETSLLPRFKTIFLEYLFILAMLACIVDYLRSDYASKFHRKLHEGNGECLHRWATNAIYNENQAVYLGE